MGANSKNLCLVFLLPVLLALASQSAAQAISYSRFRVRPCNAEEDAIKSSAEAVRLFAGEQPEFSWCESVGVPWLPNAQILRFHTRIHTDYSMACTVVKATNRSPLRLIAAAGDGLVAKPSPNLPKSVNAMNELLRSAKPALSDSQLGLASILYLFLTGREDRDGLFRGPSTAHTLDASDYPMFYQKQGKARMVVLSTSSGEWKLKFSSDKYGPKLDSIVENSGE